jgi:hypothetical protein
MTRCTAIENRRIYTVDHDSQVCCFGRKEEKPRPDEDCKS